jgi:hypothetical protein
VALLCKIWSHRWECIATVQVSESTVRDQGGSYYDGTCYDITRTTTTSDCSEKCSRCGAERVRRVVHESASELDLYS